MNSLPHTFCTEKIHRARQKHKETSLAVLDPTNLFSTRFFKGQIHQDGFVIYVSVSRYRHNSLLLSFNLSLVMRVGKLLVSSHSPPPLENAMGIGIVWKKDIFVLCSIFLYLCILQQHLRANCLPLMRPCVWIYLNESPSNSVFFWLLRSIYFLSVAFSGIMQFPPHHLNHQMQIGSICEVTEGSLLSSLFKLKIQKHLNSILGRTPFIEMN